MKITRCAFVLLLALCAAPAWADEFDIGLSISSYPQLVLVPGYPVYYAPEVQANYFFYDGDYWLYENDNWYKSPWYDGPWEFVDPEEVPDVLLQIPIRYYVAPPTFFFSWIITDHPHWGEHWGHEWERRRHGWDRHDGPWGRPAPLPDYQRRYSGDRYPRARERQYELQHRNYRYQPQPPAIQRYQPQAPIQQQQTQPVQITPALPRITRPPEVARPLHRHEERATPPAPVNVPRQVMPQPEQARERERGPAAAPPGIIRREQVIRGNQGAAKREGGREERRGQEQDRGRDR